MRLVAAPHCFSSLQQAVLFLFSTANWYQRPTYPQQTQRFGLSEGRQDPHLGNTLGLFNKVKRPEKHPSFPTVAGEDEIL